MEIGFTSHNNRQDPVKFRVIVVGLITNEQGDYLICKTPDDRGVFPGKWGLPGGGLEQGESSEAALRREINEELGIEIQNIEPLFFSDGKYEKLFIDGTSREIYMIFLIFSCKIASSIIKPGAEVSDYLWVKANLFGDYDLNEETVKTFTRMGLLKDFK